MVGIILLMGFSIIFILFLFIFIGLAIPQP
jgi:hypothetical protein